MAQKTTIKNRVKGIKTAVKKVKVQGGAHESRYIESHTKLLKIVTDLKKEGKKIILTQGVYDLIHEGHAKYLAAARMYGDVLIVGVDSDELTKKRKGPNRPIVPQNERITMLCHIRPVDIVTLRDIKDDIGDLIRLIKPDVYVASESTKDFTKKLLGAYMHDCGKIVVLPPQATTSTSARIRNLTIEGAENLAAEIQKITAEFLEKIKKG